MDKLKNFLPAVLLFLSCILIYIIDMFYVYSHSHNVKAVIVYAIIFYIAYPIVDTLISVLKDKFSKQSMEDKLNEQEK